MRKPRNEAGHQKISRNSYCSSPRKSLVKGERFIRSEEKQECTIDKMSKCLKSFSVIASSVTVHNTCLIVHTAHRCHSETNALKNFYKSQNWYSECILSTNNLTYCYTHAVHSGSLLPWPRLYFLKKMLYSVKHWMLFSYRWTCDVSKKFERRDDVKCFHRTPERRY